MSYSPPNLKFMDGLPHPGSQPDSLYVIPLAIVFQAAAMPFGPSLVKKIGSRNTLLLGSWIVALSVYLASFQKSLSTFMLFYSAMFGTGCGLAYVAPMIAGWSYLPQSKGLVSGGILAGFGAGGFFFSLIGSKLVNPALHNAVNGVFPSEVYDNFPHMLRTLSFLYAIVALIGSLLVFEPKVAPTAIPTTVTTSNIKQTTHSIPQKVVISDGLTVNEALKSSHFWLMWAMAVSSGTAGLNTASIYKQFASTSATLTGDSYQALVGGLGAICNGSGRLFWGLLSDKIGFKKSFTLLTLLQMVSMLTYIKSTNTKVIHSLLFLLIDTYYFIYRLHF